MILCDNDVLQKLAVTDLFDAALNAHGASDGDVRILASAPYALRVKKHPDKGRKRLGEIGFARLEALLGRVGSIDWDPPRAADLATFPEIDLPP